MRYHVLDTETVGLKPFEHGGGVCELSVRVIDEDCNELAHYHSLLDPEGPISATAAGIHGIRDRDVVDFPTMVEYLNIVLDQNPWDQDQDGISFIAHNAVFDWKFMAPYIECPARLVDTLALARRYYPEAENHKLTTLAVLLDLEVFDAHNAHGAAADTAVLLAFLRKLSEDTGLSLEELCVDAQRKDPIEKMPFGKHKGRTLKDMAKNERSYLRWCLDKMDALQPDVREAIEHALAA